MSRLLLLPSHRTWDRISDDMYLMIDGFFCRTALYYGVGYIESSEEHLLDSFLPAGGTL